MAATIRLSQQHSCSFNHLVGGDEQLVGHSEAQHPGSLVIDDQLELARLHDRQLRWLRALENAAGIEADLTERIRYVGSVAHQAADFSYVTVRKYRGERVSRRQVDQLGTPAV